MKIIATSDWHLGNIFHEVDRQPEQAHFLNWLKQTIKETDADALLVAGDIFDNANPSALAQETYYQFLADVTAMCPWLKIVITAGNHDSASRLEAPAALLRRHGINVRGSLHRKLVRVGDTEQWVFNLDNLIIPLQDRTGNENIMVLAVPFLRSEVMRNGSYSDGVNDLLRSLTAKARAEHPGVPLVMMAHMYANGAAIANNSSEKIVGGEEAVAFSGWEGHPDYMTCGHIHRRQPIWGTSWARYSGSVLPMSFAERDYHHGVDLVSISTDGKPEVQFIEYVPQHKLMTIPKSGALPIRELKKAIKEQLADRVGDKLSDHSVYLELKLESLNVSNDDRSEITKLVETKDAVICHIEHVLPECAVSSVNNEQRFMSVDEVLNRDPMEAIAECFVAVKGHELTDEQRGLVADAIKDVNTYFNEED